MVYFYASLQFTVRNQVIIINHYYFIILIIINGIKCNKIFTNECNLLWEITAWLLELMR